MLLLDRIHEGARNEEIYSAEDMRACERATVNAAARIECRWERFFDREPGCALACVLVAWQVFLRFDKMGITSQSGKLFIAGEKAGGGRKSSGELRSEVLGIDPKLGHQSRSSFHLRLPVLPRPGPSPLRGLLRRKGYGKRSYRGTRTSASFSSASRRCPLFQ